jgi:hypothetical protein
MSRRSHGPDTRTGYSEAEKTPKAKEGGQTDEPTRIIPWNQEEEIALCKGWIKASENGAIGNAGRENGFWNDVVAYIESKTKSDRRTYDMVCGKWKTVCLSVCRFCGVFNNIKRMNPMSRTGDEDYNNTATLNYEAEYGMKFTLRHCWEELRGYQK